MDITIYPQKINGTVAAIPSKSQAHRILICAAFADKETVVYCPQTNQDIEATVSCLCALGADIRREQTGYLVRPISSVPERAVIHCRESGSTLRFLLPVVCALGIETTIQMEGRLPYRPMSPLWELLEQKGCSLTRPTPTTIRTSGKLTPGEFVIAGNVSSQFISGLLFALPLLDGVSRIIIEGKLESKPYVEMTQMVLAQFDVHTDQFLIKGSRPFTSPTTVNVEGDWSNAAFYLVSAAIGNEVSVTNLNPKSPQGDRAVADILFARQNMPVISAADIPDLVPILSVYFASKGGAKFTDITRLRLKESDRVESVKRMLQAFGVQVITEKNTMTVYAGQFQSAVIDACGDHRIAMTAAIAATKALGPVTILGAECVAKSYPSFWEEYQRLGGKYEQYIR